MFLTRIKMYSSENLEQNTCKLQRVNDKCLNAVAQDYMYLWKYTNKDYCSKLPCYVPFFKNKMVFPKLPWVITLKEFSCLRTYIMFLYIIFTYVFSNIFMVSF